MEGGIAQTLASPTLGYADGHDFARGTKFRQGDRPATGASRWPGGWEDSTVLGQVHATGQDVLLGLGAPITAIDVTHEQVDSRHDGHVPRAPPTCVRDAKSGDLTTALRPEPAAHPRPGCSSSSRRTPPRLGAPLVKGKFTWVTEQGEQERWIVASCGTYSILFNFRRAKAATAPSAGCWSLPTTTSWRRTRRLPSPRSFTKFTGNDTHLVRHDQGRRVLRRRIGSADRAESVSPSTTLAGIFVRLLRDVEFGPSEKRAYHTGVASTWIPRRAVAAGEEDAGACCSCCRGRRSKRTKTRTTSR